MSKKIKSNITRTSFTCGTKRKQFVHKKNRFDDANTSTRNSLFCYRYKYNLLFLFYNFKIILKTLRVNYFLFIFNFSSFFAVAIAFWFCFVQNAYTKNSSVKRSSYERFMETTRLFNSSSNLLGFANRFASFWSIRCLRYNILQ